MIKKKSKKVIDKAEKHSDAADILEVEELEEEDSGKEERKCNYGSFVLRHTDILLSSVFA